MTAPTQKKPGSVFVLGLLVGIVAGWVASYSFTDGGESASAPEKGASHAAQPSPRQRPAPDDSKPRNPHARPDGNENPHDGQKASHAQGGGGGDASFARIHFMKKFVKALTATPANRWPNAAYEPLLKNVEKPLRCTDCHDSENLNFEAMKQLDPGSEKVEVFRRNPTFMIPLMKKWVARLNERHADRLTKLVTCTDCHSIDPEVAWAEVPPLMVNFVDALRQTPKNSNPAKGWKPLLKDTSSKSMLCSTCHGEIGKLMEPNVELARKRQPSKLAGNKSFMIGLMESWVEKLNRAAGDLLVKQVTCLDCHETDPRK